MKKNDRTRCFLMVVVLMVVIQTGAWAQEELTMEIYQGGLNRQITVTAITGDTTYLPVRQMSELIGLPLQWEPNLSAVVCYSYEQVTVIPPGINQIYIIKDKIATYQVTGKPFMEKGRVYMPLRSLETLGVGVIYDPVTTKRSIYVPENIQRSPGTISLEQVIQVRDMIAKERAKMPQKIGSFSTNFNASDKERTQNLKLAAQAIHNIELSPGKRFSFNETVGPRTPQRGYEKAGVFVNKELVDGYGGGICQVSSTLYNAVQNAGLSIVERHSHSLPVSYVPKGKDATVSYGALDFKFKNNLETPVSLKTRVEGNKLTIEVYLMPY
ncbi:VanW family protein [Dehalobacterium formicoaceticum]|uniref:VanW family protein n=1 Tax=Dehalobacterium formicoaceticum TaxID=51515 RepID=A0ABT1Y3S7_9FIRM|nr:VanW family protein [Dehalobacterium formicoaceticum]MCR6545526.1 VanW family protein [Dehalobacterium formicoaceticum]